jgi:uncharacterized membrane protein
MTDSASARPAHGPQTLEAFRRRRRPHRDINREQREKLTPLQRLAVLITQSVGTMGFFFIILTWTVLWLGWNFLAPKPMRFDPPMGFIFWLFISNVIQILLMPLIMVGQNVQGAHAEARAEHDLEINVKAEQEIEVILEHLEYQNNLLLEMMNRLNVNVAQALDQSSPQDVGDGPR